MSKSKWVGQIDGLLGGSLEATTVGPQLRDQQKFTGKDLEAKLGVTLFVFTPRNEKSFPVR